MHCFPVVGRHHFDSVPRAAVEKRALRPFADALLTTDAEFGVNFDATERRVIFVGNPEHARLNRAILDARGRTRTARAAVGGDGEDARLLLARGFPVAHRHRPMFFDSLDHSRALPLRVFSGWTCGNHFNTTLQAAQSSFSPDPAELECGFIKR